MAMIEMKKTQIFAKAHELANLCDAEVAVIVISSDGKILKFANSNMERILAKCSEPDNLPACESKSEMQEPEKQVLEEIDILKAEAEMLKSKQLKVLDEDLTSMDLDELTVLQEQLEEGMLCIKDRKAQILIDQILQSKMQEQQVLQENKILQRQIEELQGFLWPTKTEHEVKLEDTEFLPSTSFTATLAIDKGQCKSKPSDEDLDTTLHTFVLSDHEVKAI